MRTKGYKCFNVKCGSCVGHSLCGEPADAALGCASRMVNIVTNADRIRAMSDEELAEFLCGVYDDDNCGVYQDECGKFINGTTIIDYDQHKIADWLQQPAE